MIQIWFAHQINFSKKFIIINSKSFILSKDKNFTFLQSFVFAHTSKILKKNYFLQYSGSERNLSRRQSYNRVKQRRSESIIKSEHVIFADEITADNEKFSPAHDEIPDELVEGILSKYDFWVWRTLPKRSNYQVHY